MKGYKIFNPNWKCVDKQYVCPGEFEEDLYPKPCFRGMHFCETITECVFYKGLFFGTAMENHNKIAEVEAYGDIEESESSIAKKYATNKLRIIRKIPMHEAAEIIKKEIEGNDFMADMLLRSICPTIFFASDKYYGFQWFYKDVLGIETYSDFCKEVAEASLRLINDDF